MLRWIRRRAVSAGDRWLIAGQLGLGFGLVGRALAGQLGWGHTLIFVVISCCGYAVYLSCVGKAVVRSIRSHSQAEQSDPHS
jgi:hypothetical protein